MDNTLLQALEADQLALLEFDNIILGFPQKQVLTIESLSNIKSQCNTERSSGTVSFGDAELPVYTFNHDLRLLNEPTSNNRFCIAIKHDDESESFAIMCDAVSQYAVDDKKNIMAIPPLMHNSDSPVIGLMKKDDTLALLSSGESMREYIDLKEFDVQAEI